MEKRLTMFFAALFLSLGMAMAQTTVKGTVISQDDGQPIIGAAVQVVGTKTGLLTDMNGQFTITLPAGKTQLQISYLGMEPQTVTAKNGMKVFLKSDAASIEEVMVVAYGTQKKQTFTGSATVVGSEEIGKVQVTNAVDALKGKAAGVQIYTASGQPGSTPSVRIRGINSLNAGNAPLIVVDGSPYDGSLNDINPVDVESMTVLKDAASTSLYGARGGNGVIMITTKSAKKGKDAVITVDAKWGANHRAIPDYEMISNPAAYYEMWYKGLYNYVTDTYGYNHNQAWVFANNHLTQSDAYGLAYNVYNVPNGQALIGQNGKLNPNATLGNVISYNGNEYLLTPDNWIDATYKTSLRQEYTVSASGASNRGTFYASFNYLDNEGITPQSNYDRFTARVNADYQLKSWLKLGMNMTYGHYKRDMVDGDGDSGSSGNMFAMNMIAPIYPLYIRDAQGNIIYDETARINNYDYGDGKIIGISRPYLGSGNQLSSAQLDRNRTEGNTFNGTATVEIRLPYGFTFNTIDNYYLRETRSTQTTNPFFGQYASSNGVIVIDHDRSWSYNHQQRLSWHQQYGLHDVEAMVAHEYYRMHGYDLWGQRNNMFSPYYYELAGAVKVQNTNSSATDYNTESWLGRVMYNFDNRYFGQVSLVHQASSLFDPDHRWGTFWSLSAGWNINREKWFKADWVDELKFKLSYGENGNDNIDAYRYITYYNIVNSNDEVSLTPAAYGNQSITWEKAAKFNVGFDFSLFNGRLDGSIEYYANKTRDMIQTMPLPYTFGYTSYLGNIGSMVNRGFEFSLRGDIIRNKDLTWSAYVNLTTNHNEVTELAEFSKQQYLGGGYMGMYSGNYLKTEGLSAYTFYLNKYAGVDPETGKSLWYKEVWAKDDNGEYKKNDDGTYVVEEVVTTDEYSEATKFATEDALADVYGGFGTGLQWKGFDVSVDFTYQLGGYVYDGTYASLMGNNNGRAIHVDMLNAWSATNTNSNIPRWQYNDDRMNASSDRWLTSASYLSLQNITLGYTLPKSLTMKLGIQKIRIYGVADNIWVWSKRQGLDPRLSITGGSSSAYYSAVRTISGGITVTF
jgi:TonB-linked SusC/RagA family outer membrane protein